MTKKMPETIKQPIAGDRRGSMLSAAKRSSVVKSRPVAKAPAKAKANFKAGPVAKPKAKVKAKRMRRGEAEQRIPEILDAAVEAFAEYGYLGTSMEDIAARIGVSKPVIYRQFPSKYALLEALLNRQLLPNFANTAAMIRAYEGPVIPLLQMIHARFKNNSQLATQDLAMFRIILADAHRLPEFTQNFGRTGLSANGEALSVVFERAMAKGKMRKTNALFAGREFLAPIVHSSTMMAIMGFDKLEEWRTYEYLDHAFASFVRNYEIKE